VTEYKIEQIGYVWAVCRDNVLIGHYGSELTAQRAVRNAKIDDIQSKS